MTYHQVPNINLFIRPEHIKLKFRKQEDYTNYISLTLAQYLNKVKKRINKYPEEWDNIKRITNSYEYIHTIIPYSKHLRFNTADKYYGMTLLDNENDNVPGWKKSLLFLKKNKNVFIEKGVDGMGDLYSPDNFKYCYETYKNSMDFMTADGGFDFSVDFNKQEAMALRLIFTEVIYAIIMQKKNGNFVLKMFDTFLKSSIDIIFMLSSLYSEVYITKPDTSRTANSERYIVCKGFKLDDSSYLFNKLHHILIMLNNSQIDVLTIQSLIDVPLPYKFKISIAEINSILGNQQIDNILTTMRFIENKERKGEKINTLRSANIQKCVTWCIKNKIPYHKTASTGNIFMTNRKMKSTINKTL